MVESVVAGSCLLQQCLDAGDVEGRLAQWQQQPVSAATSSVLLQTQQAQMAVRQMVVVVVSLRQGKRLGQVTG